MNTLNELMHESYNPEKCDQHCKKAALFSVTRKCFNLYIQIVGVMSNIAHVEKHAEIQKINATG
jgi:hypothetical protein